VGLDRVGDINMDDNELVELDLRAFHATPHLHSFSGRSNHLRVADLRLRQYAPNLRILDLAENRISELIPPENDDGGFFPIGGGLSMLSLAENSLQTMDKDVVKALSRDGATVRVHGNPWYCDCRLDWLMTVLRRRSRHKVDHPNSVICKSPPYLAGRKVNTLIFNFIISYILVHCVRFSSSVFYRYCRECNGDYSLNHRTSQTADNDPGLTASPNFENHSSA